MRTCEECRMTFGRHREGYAHQLPDRQRVSLCLACASRWRMAWPSYAPRPYGREAREAVQRAHDEAMALLGSP